MKAYHHVRKLLLLALFPAMVGCSGDAESPYAARDLATTSDVASAPFEVGQGTRDVWRDHLVQDLMRYWMMPEALGTPVGNFPTFRDRAGNVYDPRNPSPEFANADPWIRDNLDKDYVRMKSRQIFAYGVAYHVTGEVKYLELAKAGVDFLRSRALQPDGSVVSYFVNGEPDQLGLARTSQDYAYGLQGLAFYYYLTRDEGVLEDILKAKAVLDASYRRSFVNPATHDTYRGMAWAAAGPDADVQDLVVPLDQINAYMLAITPLLPPAIRTQWTSDMLAHLRVILEQHYAPDLNVFRGMLTSEAVPSSDTAHTDFGHSIKTFWMTYFLGRLVGNDELVRFAEERGRAMLSWAYLEDEGAWSQNPILGTDQVARTKEWWSYAELDQFAATIGLHDPSALHYLERTYAYWLEEFVDHEHGEVFHYITETGDKTRYPKTHLWKNGFHSVEHALVAYITSRATRKEPVSLYFALPRGSRAAAVPYYFQGDEILRVSVPLHARNVSPKHQKVRVTFTNVR